MADRIVVMNHGVIEQVGTPMEVYREPGLALRRRFRRQGERAADPPKREMEPGAKSVRCTSVATTRRRDRRGEVYLRP